MQLKVARPLIVIVDDDEFVCRAVKRVLNSNGMEVLTFSSGTRFIAMLDEMPSFTPDCVILDVHMPEMNGLEVQNLLASRRPGTPVFFLTADRTPGQLERLRAAGVVAVLQKPVQVDDLVQAIRWTLN